MTMTTPPELAPRETKPPHQPSLGTVVFGGLLVFVGIAWLLDRLITLVDGYDRDASPRPWPERVVDSSARALPVAGPFPRDLKTIDRAFDFPTSYRSVRADGVVIPAAEREDAQEDPVRRRRARAPRQRTLDDWAPERTRRPR